MGNTKDTKPLKSILMMLFFTLLLIILTPNLHNHVVSSGIEDVVSKTAKESSQASKLVVYLFWGQGCHICDQMKLFLEEMQKKYPNIEVKKYEVFYNKGNYNLLSQMLSAYNKRFSGVPVIFIGEKSFSGFSEQHKINLEEAISSCLTEGCIDPIKKVKPSKKEPSSTQKVIGNSNDKVTGVQNSNMEHKTENQHPNEGTKPTSVQNQKEEKTTSDIKAGIKKDPTTTKLSQKETIKLVNKQDNSPQKEQDSSFINIPLLGKVNALEVSIPLVTVIIAGIDSFNPCTFFVLFSLLGLLVYARSRKKMFLIGSTFVFFSGLIYFLFMTAWLNLFLIMGHLVVITIVAAIVSIVIAIINIKDFFFFKKGISLTIPGSAKPKLFDRMRKLVKSTSLLSIILGTVVLAVVANSYELLCTAGLPMVFTRILTLNNLPPLTYYLYLILYNLVYIIPLILIVIIFTITLGKRNLTEWQGRVLKLVSGVMMLGLGVVLLVNPSLLNNLLISLVIVLGSVAGSLAIAFLTKSKLNGDM